MQTKLPLYLALLLLTQCSKCKDDPKPANPVDQLPPATQTGANTFGCLVNGQAWTPQGNDGSSNYTVSYDRLYHDGTLNVAAYRYGSNALDDQVIGVASDSLKATGTFRIRPFGRHIAVFVNRRTNCSYYSSDTSTYSRGRLIITRLDLQAGVVSGTFWFTIYKPGCDSVRVTDGRFDRKL